MKVIKESEDVGLLKIKDDLFTYDSPLGAIFNEFNRLSRMEDDLFTREVEIPGLSFIPCDEAIHDERELNDDHDIGNLDNDLVRDNAPYHTNEKEELYEEGRCELLRNPCQEPPVCRIKRFEVIKYSFM
ncbi:hypothetical protein Tco_0304334 [Tanacetum coccineum]